jgi:hypothetical protein
VAEERTGIWVKALVNLDDPWVIGCDDGDIEESSICIEPADAGADPALVTAADGDAAE